MSLGTQEQRTEGMKRQAQDLIDQAYQRGYKAAQEANSEAVAQLKENYLAEGIEQGRNEAWEAVKKLHTVTVHEAFEILHSEDKDFEDMTFSEIVCQLSASEVIEKVRAYEEQKKLEEDQEIHVGDEVVTAAGDKGVVIGINNNDVYLLISGWNVAQVTHKLCCKKTGCTFQEIAEVLKRAQEGE